MNIQERANQQLSEHDKSSSRYNIRAESQARYNDSFKKPMHDARVKRSKSVYEIVKTLDTVIKDNDDTLRYRESLASKFRSVNIKVDNSILTLSLMVREACDILNNSRFKYDFIISIEAIRNAIILEHSQGDILIGRGYSIEVHLINFLSMKSYDKRIDFLNHQEYDFTSELAELEAKENSLKEGVDAGASLMFKKKKDELEALELAQESEMLARLKRDDATLERLKAKGLLSA